MILDKINTESSVANRAMMPDYLDPKRFPWVFFVDSFMWPFNNQRETARNSDEGVYIPLQEKMLHRWMQQENVTKLPADFDDYLNFISQVLEDNRKKGGIAMKFEVAYFRPTTFSDPTREQAEDIYARYVCGGIPSEKEYRTFQDYIFRYLVTEGGTLHLPVHIHTAVGIGDYFNLSQSNIMNLESVLRDPRYRSTTFVMIHGGYPLEREAIWLAAMKECLPRFLLRRTRAVSVRLQRHAENVAGNFSRQDHFRHGLLSRTMKCWARKKATGWVRSRRAPLWPRLWPR